jgi:hypothetical protein
MRRVLLRLLRRAGPDGDDKVVPVISGVAAQNGSPSCGGAPPW